MSNIHGAVFIISRVYVLLTLEDTAPINNAGTYHRHPLGTDVLKRTHGLKSIDILILHNSYRIWHSYLTQFKVCTHQPELHDSQLGIPIVFAMFTYKGGYV